MASSDVASAPVVNCPEAVSTGLVVVVVVVGVVGLIDVVVRWLEIDAGGRPLEQPPKRPPQASATRISRNLASVTSRSCHPDGRHPAVSVSGRSALSTPDSVDSGSNTSPHRLQ